MLGLCYHAFMTVAHDNHLYSTGRWSEEERQKLHTLVLKFLHEKSQVAKTGQLTKNHRGVSFLLVFTILRPLLNWYVTVFTEMLESESLLAQYTSNRYLE